MRKAIFCIAAGLCMTYSAGAQSQTCPTLKLRDGMQLIYATETAPPPLYKMKGEYFKAKPKEQQKMKEQYMKEPWNKDIQTNTVKIENFEGGNFISTTVKRGKEATSAVYYSSCNDKDYISRGALFNWMPREKSSEII